MAKQSFTTRNGQDGAYGDLSVELDLPEMTGSPKQITWATDLRQRWLWAYVRKMVTSPGAALHMTPTNAAQLQTLLQTVVTNATTAKEWIDLEQASDPTPLSTLARRYIQR